MKHSGSGSAGQTSTIRPTGLTVGGKITHVSLTDTTWTALPTTPLSGRNSILVQNISDNGNIILWNYDNAAPATEGARIPDGNYKTAILTDSIIIYGRMLSGSGTACVDEVA